MYMGNRDYTMRQLGYSLTGYSLREAEGDPNTTDAEDTNAEETEDAGDPNVDNEETTNTEGDSTEESPEEDTGEEEADTGEDNGDENFDIDAEDDTGDGGEGESDDMEDDSSSDDPNSDSEEEDEEIDPNSLKALDGKLYEDLSPAEQRLKIRQQKQLFTELFYSCASVAEKINSIYVEDDEATLQIKMGGSMIFNLKQMISDYFLNTFESKSYQENDIMFNRYLEVLNQVKLLTEEIKKTYFSDSE